MRSRGPRLQAALAASTLAVAAVVATAVPVGAEDLPANTTRYAGANRYATAAEFVTERWRAGPSLAYVVTGTAFADALSGAPAAAAGGGPVLLTAPTVLPDETKAALETLRPASIVVVGGTGAISEQVFIELHSYTRGSVTRVAGTDRYQTAAAVSQRSFPSLDDSFAWAFVASGERFPDALGGAAAASAEPQSPLLLTQRDSLPAATRDELHRLQPDRIYVLGGPAAISEAVASELAAVTADVVRIAGADRYETAARVAQATFNSKPELVVATGMAFADGLVGAALGSPLVLVPGDGTVPVVVDETIDALDPIEALVMGGSAAVTEGQARHIGERIQQSR